MHQFNWLRVIKQPLIHSNWRYCLSVTPFLLLLGCASKREEPVSNNKPQNFAGSKQEYGITSQGEKLLLPNKTEISLMFDFNGHGALIETSKKKIFGLIDGGLIVKDILWEIKDDSLYIEEIVPSGENRNDAIGFKRTVIGDSLILENVATLYTLKYKNVIMHKAAKKPDEGEIVSTLVNNTYISIIKQDFNDENSAEEIKDKVLGSGLSNDIIKGFEAAAGQFTKSTISFYQDGLYINRDELVDPEKVLGGNRLSTAYAGAWSVKGKDSLYCWPNGKEMPGELAKSYRFKIVPFDKGIILINGSPKAGVLFVYKKVEYIPVQMPKS
ncbi:hypothetical protein IC229_28785 [Spirosoma sp. BT702]|uniref:Uncharacterized protein n=1 Tax=Spirosoma profusum TaxID=2771354 RepID=A0A927AUJ7_9BACT|nr:hypothetical protein [Spirosoma profusum]MBD2704667.1 hypothetical protein [Spirosoma profusum]